MTLRTEAPCIGLWELAVRISASPDANSWTVVLSGVTSPAQLARELCGQLAALDEVATPSAVRTVDALVEVVRHEPDSILVLHGLDSLGEHGWEVVDRRRSRLFRRGRTILAMTDSSLQDLVRAAPNLWSWIGGQFWRAVDDELLSEEERKDRLRALRSRHAFADEDVVALAESGRLPPDPDFAEWLLLIRRSDLLAAPDR